MKVTVKSNLENVEQDMREAIERIVSEHNPILLVGASSVLALVHDRIHGDGNKANGSALGTYSNSYMRVRRANNRTEDRTVIASLTRQMENDFTVVAVNDAVGLGFQNNHNGDKARFIELRYPGTYNISASEEKIFTEAVSNYISDLFK